MYVKSYRDLKVYKLARQLSKEIFELTKTYPKEELYSLISRIRKSSRSMGAQIAEAWAKRRYPAHFISKLTGFLFVRSRMSTMLSNSITSTCE